MREFKKPYYTTSMESNSVDMLKSLAVRAKECRSLENVHFSHNREERR